MKYQWSASSLNPTIFKGAEIFRDYGDIALPVAVDKLLQGNLGDKTNEYLVLAGNVCLTDVMTKTMLNLMTTNTVKIMEFDFATFKTHAYNLAFDEAQGGKEHTLNNDKLKATALKIAAACAIKFFLTDSTKEPATSDFNYC